MNDRIEYILNNFDFEKVKVIMKTLNWTWQDKKDIPTYNELRYTAKHHLETVARENSTMSSSGGFSARNEYGEVSLEFVAVTSSDYGFEEK